MMTRVFTLMIGLLVATAAHAMRGDEFVQLLDAWNRANSVSAGKAATREDELSASAFTGYVRGVEDSMNGVKYVKAHPEELHNGATTLIVQALQPAFPCEGLK